MFLRNFKSDSGSALLEFITFILIGQLFVFGGSMLISTELAQKVELQVLASQTARNIALNREATLPADVTVVEGSCVARVICVTLRRGNQSVSAVSYQ